MYLNALLDGDIPDAESLSVNDLPTVACWSLNVNAKAKQCPGGVVASSSFQSIDTDTNPCHSPAVACQKNSLAAVNNSNPLSAVEPREAQSKANITYGKYYQGEIGFEHEIDVCAPYLTLRSALMNTFNGNNYAIIVLQGYVI